jgi:Tol biopolymer transport system component
MLSCDETRPSRASAGTRRRWTVVVAAAALAVCAMAGVAGAAPETQNGLIAFTASVNGTSQVFTINPDGTGLTQITDVRGGAGEYGLAWSPDGSGLLFTAVDAGGRDATYKAGADGSHMTLLRAGCRGRCLGDDAPSYSPNGKKIVFERAFGPIVNNNASVVGIFTMSARGGNATQLTQKTKPTSSEDHDPHWSPDGKKIVFVRLNTRAEPANQTAIFLMKANGSDVQQLTPFAVDAANPRWSPDGSRILYDTYSDPSPGKSANLYTMRPDGTHKIQLTRFSGGGIQAFANAWSPDGSQVVFHEVGGNRSALFVINANGSHPRQLTHLPAAANASHATWGSAG